MPYLLSNGTFTADKIQAVVDALDFNLSFNQFTIPFMDDYGMKLWVSESVQGDVQELTAYNTKSLTNRLNSRYNVELNLISASMAEDGQSINVDYTLD